MLGYSFRIMLKLIPKMIWDEHLYHMQLNTEIQPLFSYFLIIMPKSTLRTIGDKRLC